MSKVFYDTKEAATILKLKERTVEKLCREGKIKAVKPSKKWLIAKQDLEEFLTQKSSSHE